MTIIVTPRPPLSLMEVVRVTADDTSGGTLVYEVPTYRIPASGPTPQRDVEAAAVITNLTISDLVSGTSGSTVSVTIETLGGGTGSETFVLTSAAVVPKNGFISLDVEKQVLKSEDRLIVEMSAADTADVHFSFILVTREEYTVLP
jgi:hypothetical protein